MKSFTDSSSEFIERADWLTDEHDVLVTALLHTAEELDKGGVQASLINQFRLIFKSLQRNAGATEEVDPLDALLNE